MNFNWANYSCIGVISRQDTDMATVSAQHVYTAQAVATMSAQHVAQLLQSKTATIASLEHQIDWFRRQLFGKGC